MDIGHHELTELFAQLGLDNSTKAINQFVQSHPLPEQVVLAEAPFWSASQAAFLRQSLDCDAEWSDAVDTLATLLQQRG